MSIITLTKYKEFKGINSDKNDIVINSTIDAVNSFITSYCNRSFTASYSTDTVEYFDSIYRELYPKEYPLQVVTSIAVSTDGGQTYPTILSEFTDYIVDKTNSRIVSQIGDFVDTLYKTNSIMVTYKGGYASVPPELSLAAANLVEYYIDEQYTPSKSMTGSSVENLIAPDVTARLPPHIRRVLEHYRSIEL